MVNAASYRASLQPARGLSQAQLVKFFLEYYALLHRHSTQVSNHEDDSNTDTEIIGIMKKWGLSKEFQDAVMDPEFSDIRLTESLRAWVYGTIRLRYDSLQFIGKASLLRDELHTGITNDASEVMNALVLTLPKNTRLRREKERAKAKQLDSQEMKVLYKPAQATQVFDVFYRRKENPAPTVSHRFSDCLQVYNLGDTAPADFAN